MRFLHRVVNSRPFRLFVVAVLFFAAIRLRGEVLTVTALVARALEEVAELFLDSAIHRG